MASIPEGKDSVPEPPVVNTDSTPMAKAGKDEKPLPKLSATEFRQYNRMAEHMDYFHNNFRQTWKVLYDACEAGKRPKNMSIRQFISTGQQFCHQ
jgi:murein L,D-transpeptidase YafK